MNIYGIVDFFVQILENSFCLVESLNDRILAHHEIKEIMIQIMEKETKKKFMEIIKMWVLPPSHTFSHYYYSNMC